MIYSPRLLEILKVLAKNNDYVSTHVLAELLGVSNRTIFRELQDVNYLLEPFNIKLESKAGYGFKIIGETHNIDRFIHSLESSQNRLPYRNVEERRELLMIECLLQTNMIKLSNLAAIFDVSEGTISRDLDMVEKKLKHYNLELIRRQGYGIEINGSEDNVRRAIIEAVHGQLSTQNEQLFDRGHQDIVQYFQSQESGILGLLNQETIYNVIDVLEHSSTNIVNKITEHSYIGLVIHLTIAVERILTGDAMQVKKRHNISFENEVMYHEAKIIVSDIETRFNVKFPKAEVGYVLMHLKGTRPRNHSQSTESHVKNNYDCMLMVESLISRFSSIMGEDFTHDESLSTGLLAHLKPTLNRIEYKLEIRNPLLDEIKEQYSELFEIVKDTSNILYLENNLKLSDDEIGYLTLHFGAALERQKLKDSVTNAINIGVVCASGIGISALLASKIRSTFYDAREVIPLSVDDVEYNTLNNIDLLVATLEIDSVIPTVYVNSLLRNEDLIEIRKAIDGLQKGIDFRLEKNHQTYDLSVLNYIQLIDISLNNHKDVLIQELITKCRNSSKLHQDIESGIHQREMHDSVIISEINFVMYHAKIPKLEFPEVIFFRSNELSRHSNFKDIDCGVFMIVPYPAPSEIRKTMSKITEAILDCDELIPVIKQGNEVQIKKVIEKFLKEKTYG